jgi:Uncharacterized protein conserved in bacteria (DUF2252)
MHPTTCRRCRRFFGTTDDGTVAAQRTLQSSIAVLLGWTNIDGRSYFVRQMKNMKGSIPVKWLVGAPFNEYALACGAILARSHARW